MIQCVTSIQFLLAEIEVIRRKYELRPSDDNNSILGGKSTRARKSLRCLSDPKPMNALRQRIEDNQKQKSFLSLTKWSMYDAKKFGEKVRRLTTMVDGLEDVCKAAGVSRSVSVEVQPSLNYSAENPPPYSPTRPPSQVALVPQLQSLVPRHFNIGLPAQHECLKQHVGFSLNNESPGRIKRQETLAKLNDTALYELRIDIYDELCRREQQDAPPWLPAVAPNHPDRNQARRKLSQLSPHRFTDLTTDLVFEVERRFPNWYAQAPAEAPESSDSLPSRPFRTRRYGCVFPSPGPPPLLQYREAHRRTYMPDCELSRTRLSSRFSVNSAMLDQVVEGTTVIPKPELPLPLTPAPVLPTSTSSVEIFKSFRVGIEDPTRKVLPAALKKYNIRRPWREYELYIVYGAIERCLGMDEKPLILFKELDREGLKPMFMLRRIFSTPSKVI